MTENNGSTWGWAALGSIACAAAMWALKAPEPYDLHGKVVLITGGSRGLGLLLARAFLARGSAVAVCARSEQELADIREEFAPLGDRFAAYVCDVREKDQVERMVERVEERLGQVDVLVNNAGTIQIGPLENHSLDHFEEAMRTNFWSAVYTTLAVLPGMRQKRSGRIVNITSIGGRIAVPHLLPYSASKFALVGFSRGLRTEVAKDGIMVTTVVPGLMRTGSPRNAETAGQHSKEYSWFILSDSIPGLSIDARRAAERIVEACISGTGEIVLGTAAQLALLADAVAPNTVGALLAAVNQWMLPAPDGGHLLKKGFESENLLTRSLLTLLTRQAEVANNQI